MANKQNKKTNPQIDPEKKEKKEDSWFSRNIIAFIITFSVIGLTILITIHNLFFAEKPDMTFIGQSLLPLWGTWIGTVLAFYFGKANFEAATKSYQEVIKNLTPEEKIAQLNVKDVMIPFDKIEKLEYDKEKDTKINDILSYPRFANYNRYAVFEQTNIIKYIIHKSTFHQFIAQKVDENVSVADIKNLTLQNLIDTGNEEIKRMLSKGCGFVMAKANLLNAKHTMDSIPECQDVFITENGKANEPVIGLVTNNIILEKAKV